MTYDNKARIIFFILIIVSTIIMGISLEYFQSKGLVKMAALSVCILPVTLGLNILFGKYVYLCGLVITKRLRILVGLSFILIVPMIWLIYYMTGRFD